MILIFLGGIVLWVYGVFTVCFEELTLFQLFLILVGGQLVKLAYAAWDSEQHERFCERILKAIKNLENKK